MIGKRFDQIEKSDIEALVTNQVPEGRSLDYKEQLCGQSPDDKREFLYDVSSFANTSGGDLIYGVREKRDSDGKPTGIPETACGLVNLNADIEIRRMESLVRDGIDPRIAGVEIRSVNGFPNGPVLLIRIPRSWMAPHMVTLGGVSRFYSRDNRSKYPLDVSQIRSAFALSEELPEKVRRFRADRLSRIISSEAPVPLSEQPTIVLHVVPIAAFDPATRLDIGSLASKNVQLRPMDPVSGWAPRFNLDGFVSYDQPSNSPTCHSYLQVFRNGAIEAVQCRLIDLEREYVRSIPQFSNQNIPKRIPSTRLEKEVILVVGRCLAVLKDLNLQPPAFIMLSLLRVRDYSLWVDQASGGGPIGRTDLVLPDVIAEDFGAEPGRLLRPIFDVLYQAAGHEKCYHYDDQGNWCNPR
ncbi:MAG: ATP-binding protein [Verrucomicrobiia bacterium]